MNIHSLITDIKNKKLSPLYLLHGEEPFYIDLISDTVESTVLQEAQKGFDQSVIYGKDVELHTIVSMAKRYPMMSDHQVIIVKEAQNLKWKDDEILQRYLEKPTPSTVLVFAHKYSKFDKRRKSYKIMDSVGTIFESNKIFDNKIAPWIEEQLHGKGRKIHPHAAILLGEYLGTNLSKIANELEKLVLNTPSNKEITSTDIENNIGISKDFNVFELNTALAKRNALKAFQIADYFSANPKSNPMPIIIGALGNYFIKILKYHYLKEKTAKELGVHPFHFKEYELAAKNYNRKKTFEIIHNIKEYDLKSKGLNIGHLTNSGDILTELIYKILN